MCTAKSGIAVLLLAAFLALSCGAPAALAETADVRVMMADIDWNSLDHTLCGYTSKQQMLDEVSGYAVTIAALTGRKDWTEFYGSGGVAVEIRFTESASHVEGGYQSYQKKTPRIYINRTMAQCDFWPLAHELTHLICPEYSCLTLREGLACYMQDEVGQSPAVFNYGLDVHIYACQYLAADEIDCLILTANPGYDSSTDIATGEKRAAFYLCSYSFSRYLIETYGIDRFMTAYESSNFIKASPLIYDRSANNLTAEWKQFLSDYPAKQSQEQLIQARNDVWRSHGYSHTP